MKKMIRNVSNSCNLFTLISGMLIAGGLFISSCSELADVDIDIESKELMKSTTSKISPSITGAIDILPGMNSWVSNDVTYTHPIIISSGIHNWTKQNEVVRTYVWFNSTGSIDLEFNGKAPTGSSTLTFTIGSQTKAVTLNNTSYQNIHVGNFNIPSSGYTYIEIKCTQKTSGYVADINNIYVSGSATSNGVYFIKENNPHFGRRGPSVHLTYDLPLGKDINWFYNEVTVPKGNDVEGSYFMVNGFNQGYFGMQVNSATERRVLFSVWSPWSTDNPGQIPDDYKVLLLEKGNGVNVNEFGGEGSGGQSYKIFNWKAGKTYKFLLGGKPSANNSTDYEAYFYDPDTNKWNLIAKWRRPYTTTYLKGFYSFLENFNTGTGHLVRQGKYGNQWVHATDGNWYESTGAKFTYDATASAKDRLDYKGGLSGDKYYLKNCGFFSDNTPNGTRLNRTSQGSSPTVDLNKLTSVNNPSRTLLNKLDWTIHSFSSEATEGEGSNGLAKLTIDGNDNTYWHTCWTGCNQTYVFPHNIVIDMKSDFTVNGFRFVQRNGSRKIKNLNIHAWNNGGWQLAGSCVLENHANEQFIDLKQAVKFRYFKITAVSGYDDNNSAALAEISPYTY